MDKCGAILNEYIVDGERLYLAVSGGKDSMCLLHFVMRSSIIKNCKIVVLNFEHGIRGAESVADSKFVADFCASNSLELLQIPLNIGSGQKGKSLEELAREKRREVYERLLCGEADKILLAHHKSDQCESILQHIFRGCGAKGLVGMRACKNGVLRPMLTTSREEIDNYALANNVPYVVDSTNADLHFDRNYIRGVITPAIKARFPAYEDNLVRLSRAIDGDNDYIEACANRVKIDKLDERTYRIAKQDCTHLALAVRLINRVAKALNITSDLTESHYNTIMKLATNSMPNGADFIGDLRVISEYDFLVFTTQKDVQSMPATAVVLGSTIWSPGSVEVTKGHYTADKGIQCINGALPLEKMSFRTRRNGDTFITFSGHKKKLKEYLIDRKIPRRIRDTLPLLIYEDNIIAIVGVEVGEMARVLDKTSCYKMAYICFAFDQS